MVLLRSCKQLCKAGLLAVVLAFCLSTPLQAAPDGEWASSGDSPFVIALIADPDESITMTWYVNVLREAFRRLDIDLKLEIYPGVRASSLLDLGAVDGEGLRPLGYEEDHPNAVRVDELMFNAIFAAVTVDPTLKVSSFDDLSGLDVKVEYLRGTDPLDKVLLKYVASENLSAITQPMQGLEKLLAGRTDVFIDFPARIRYLAEAVNVDVATLHVTNLASELPVYPYLHKRHASLAPRLAQVIRDIRAEGMFAEAWKQAQQELKGE